MITPSPIESRRCRCSSRCPIASAPSPSPREGRSGSLITCHLAGQSRHALCHPSPGEPQTPSAREDDLHDIAADLSRDRFGELARRLRPEGSLHPPHPATAPGKLKDDLGRPGVVREHDLNLLEQRYRSVVVKG